MAAFRMALRVESLDHGIVDYISFNARIGGQKGTEILWDLAEWRQALPTMERFADRVKSSAKIVLALGMF